MREMIQSVKVTSSLITALVLMASTVALSENIPQNAETKLISDGSKAVVIPEQGFALLPPKGWEYRVNSRGVTMVMQEVAAEVTSGPKDYSKPKFQRNITVATIQHASPIDSIRAEEFRKELTEKFSKDSLVSQFQVLEQKFFDYRSKNDGLVLFSSMNVGEFPMMQMHVLLSGSKRQHLITYTDLASEFSSNKAAYDSAWNAMVTAEVEGTPEARYMKYIPYAATGTVLLLLVLLLKILRNRRSIQEYHDDADELYNDDSKWGVAEAVRSVSASFDESVTWNLDDDSGELMSTSKRAGSNFASSHH